MSNPLPPDVIEDIEKAMELLEPNPPPKNAFTLDMYYEKLTEKLQKEGAKEMPSIDACRQRLKKMCKENEAWHNTRYPTNGPIWYWCDKQD